MGKPLEIVIAYNLKRSAVSADHGTAATDSACSANPSDSAYSTGFGIGAPGPGSGSSDCDIHSLDNDAEFDDPETIFAIKRALESRGHRVGLHEANKFFPASIAAVSPDIVFNIAEGRNGRGREAHVPAILSYLGIPYTGSDETTICVAMDKPLAKRIVSSYGISTPDYAVIGSDGIHDNAALPAFPVIVKPVAEGSGKGISGISIIKDAFELDNVAGSLISRYNQDALVEEYIPGREFTVGLLGNGNGVRVFTPMEIIFRDKTQSIYSYEIKRDFRRHIDYACPPDVGDEIIAEMQDAALKIFRILQCRDFARIDFRMSPEGRLNFIEINPIPGLAPGYSDYPMLAEFCGVSYDDLICSILSNALTRYNIEQ